MTDKKILIVEDEVDFAEMLQFSLSMIGYEVNIALDAYQGNKELVNNNFDLIVMDLGLPVGDGFSLLERLKNLQKKSKIPVVILTGKMITEDIINKARKYKVSAIFTKPYDRKKFLSKVKSLLQPV